VNAVSQDGLGWRTPPELWTKLKPLAREMRGQPTPGENLLWQALRRNQLGVHFRRQQALGPFIVDFYCTAEKLVVEVDGDSHVAKHDLDEERDAFLTSNGLRVLRFTEEQVIHDLRPVLKQITNALSPSP
jgi:very-short-patch-repair endonuclease